MTTDTDGRQARRRGKYRADGATLAEIRRWPAVVPVGHAARALGVSRAGAYAAIAAGDFPAEYIRVNRTVKVLTASLLAVLDPERGPDQAASA